MSARRLKGVMQGAIPAGMAALLWHYELRHMATVAGIMAGVVLLASVISCTLLGIVLFCLVSWVGERRLLYWLDERLNN